MADSKRVQILTAFKTRVEAIAQANGFNTGAGQHVHLGEIPGLGEDDPDVAIAIIAMDTKDQKPPSAMKIIETLPVAICAVAKAGASDSWMTVELILQDIKRAIELPDDDRRFGKLLAGYLERGGTVTLERNIGSDVVGAAVIYDCPIAEVWGNP